MSPTDELLKCLSRHPVSASVFPKPSLLLGKLSAMGYLKEMLSMVYAVSENTSEDSVGLKMMTRKFYRGTMSIQNSSNK